VSEDLVAVRLTKLERLRARGIEPYPYKFERSHTTTAVRERFADLPPNTRTGEEVRLAGRIFSLRRMGKLTFADSGTGADGFSSLFPKMSWERNMTFSWSSTSGISWASGAR